MQPQLVVSEKTTRSALMRAVRMFVMVVLGTTSAVAVTATTASAATFNVSGVVTCENGGDVQGIWVESLAGGSVWADWWAMPGRTTSAYFAKNITFAPAASTISLHIGCGRNANGSWVSTNLTPQITLNRSLILNSSCSNPRLGGRGLFCSYAPTGVVAATNSRQWGYCTYGAWELWRANTGYLPNIIGNAIDMPSFARSNGYRTSAVPQPRSLIVFKWAGTLGHVGWVNSVSLANGRVTIAYTDMNGGSGATAANGWKASGFGVFANRTTVWDPSVHEFIVARP